MDIWNHALIVFTFVNGHYALETENEKDEEQKKILYASKYEEWVDVVRKHLKRIATGTAAENIALVPAGYLNPPNEETLDFEPKGKSWVLDIWQQIAQVAPMEDKLASST